MISKVEFRRVINNDFQKRLRNELRNLCADENKVIIPADKPTNLYKVETERYHRYVQDWITDKYKNTNGNEVKNVNKEAKEIDQKCKSEERID